MLNHPFIDIIVILSCSNYRFKTGLNDDGMESIPSLPTKTANKNGSKCEVF